MLRRGPMMQHSGAHEQPQRMVAGWQGGNMPEVETGGAGLGLVIKILLATGLIGLVVGVFVMLFVSVPGGLVVMLAGLLDLVVCFLLPRIAGTQR